MLTEENKIKRKGRKVTLLSLFLCMGLWGQAGGQDRGWMDVGEPIKVGQEGLQQPDTLLAINGVVGMFPSPLHAAVRTMVEDCTGRRVLYTVEWATAQRIVGMPSGTMPYGITRLFPKDNLALVLLEQPFWFNPWAISHELIHVLYPGRTEEEVRGIMAACTIPSGHREPLRLLNRARFPSLLSDSLTIVLDIRKDSNEEG
jgi:hypothetical protein